MESSQPHIVAVAESLYDKMFHEGKDQLLLPYGTSTVGKLNDFYSMVNYSFNIKISPASL